MKGYTLNRIKSGRLINERLLRIRPLEFLKISELKSGVEYDFYMPDGRRAYAGEFVRFEGSAATFIFRRKSDYYRVSVGETKVFGLITPHMWNAARFVKSLPDEVFKPSVTYKEGDTVLLDNGYVGKIVKV